MKKILLALVGALLLMPAQSFAARYSIDPDHSNVGFKVKHLAISSVTGNFAEFSGWFDFDPQDPNAAKTEAIISAQSINTRNAKRDNHLRDNDFLLVKEHPEIKFVSKQIKNATPEKFQVLGDLTIRGVTKPAVLDVEYGGSVKDMQGKDRAAFTATTKINRKEFGVAFNKLLESGALVVGDEVTVSLEIEGVRQS